MKKKTYQTYLFLFLSFSLVLIIVRVLMLNNEPFPTLPSAHRVGTAVGLSVGVEQNPYNSIALQLSKKEDALTDREVALQELEGRLLASSQKEDRLLQYLIGISTLLTFLILLNYILDWQRGHTQGYTP